MFDGPLFHIASNHNGPCFYRGLFFQKYFMIFLVYSIIECIFVLSNTTIMANSKNNKRIKISKSLRISGSLRKFCSTKLIKRVGDIQADGQYKKAKNINVVKHTARAYWPIILN